MLAYSFLFLISILSIFLVDCSHNKKKDPILFYTLLIITISIAGLRYHVGLDSFNYIYRYQTLHGLSKFNFEDIGYFQYQPFYLLLCELCIEITSDFTLFQIVHASIVNTLIFHAIKKIIPQAQFCGIFLYLCTNYFYFNFEILKESLAVSFGLYAIITYKEKKYLKYILYTLTAFMFHVSAIILLFTPIITKIRLNKIYLFIMFLFAMSIYSIKPYIENIMPEGTILTKATIYISEADSGKLNTNWVLLQLLYYVISPGIIAYLCRKRIQVLNLESEIGAYIILGIGVIWYQIIFIRLPNYFSIFVIMAFASILKQSITQKTGVKIWKIGLISIYLIIANYNYLSHDGYRRWFPYESIFDPKDNPERIKTYTSFN